jgi:hypothetical protein
MALLSAALSYREPTLNRAHVLRQELLLIMDEKGYGHEDLGVIVGLIG